MEMLYGANGRASLELKLTRNRLIIGCLRAALGALKAKSEKGLLECPYEKIIFCTEIKRFFVAFGSSDARPSKP